jgi:hypothetical protein
MRHLFPVHHDPISPGTSSALTSSGGMPRPMTKFRGASTMMLTEVEIEFDDNHEEPRPPSRRVERPAGRARGVEQADDEKDAEEESTKSGARRMKPKRAPATGTPKSRGEPRKTARASAWKMRTSGKGFHLL